MTIKTALIFAAASFEDMELISAVDILRRGGVDLKIVSLTDSKEVLSKSKVKITADLMFCENLEADILILPGGGVLPAYLKHKSLQELIKKQHKNNKLIGAICAAPSLLGYMGILDGKMATGYPDENLRNYLKNSQILEDRVVVDGNIITSMAPATALDFALKILEILDEKRFLGVKEDIVY